MLNGLTHGETMLEARGLGRHFTDRWLFRGLSFRVKAGSRLCIWGPSGCGKTSLLRLLAGLDLPDDGEIHLNGRLVSAGTQACPPHERNMGFAFQSPALWPHMTVEENIRFGLSRLSDSESTRRLSEALQLIELTGLEQRYPEKLSGGEACRVALARALAPRPGFLLLDEPLASVEDALRERLLERLDEWLTSHSATLIYVTHDREIAARLGGERLTLPANGAEESRKEEADPSIQPDPTKRTDA
jgi:iron(III) transport system ATP-binding protein